MSEMKVKIQLPQQDVAAKVVARNSSGEVVDVHTLEITPYFFKKDGQVPVLFAEVTFDGKSYDRAVVNVGGSNGKLVLTHRTARVQPAFVGNKQPAKKTGGETNKESNKDESTNKESAKVGPNPDKPPKTGPIIDLPGQV